MLLHGACRVSPGEGATARHQDEPLFTRSPLPSGHSWPPWTLPRLLPIR
jgi:hypothetical protein